MAGRKHAIISNIEAIAKDELLIEKEIKSLKELATRKQLTREIESIGVPPEKLKKSKPLVEGMNVVKQEVIDDVFMMVTQFMCALHKVSLEKQKLKDIVTNKVSLLKILVSETDD